MKGPIDEASLARLEAEHIPQRWIRRGLFGSHYYQCQTCGERICEDRSPTLGEGCTIAVLVAHIRVLQASKGESA